MRTPPLLRRARKAVGLALAALVVALPVAPSEAVPLAPADRAPRAFGTDPFPAYDLGPLGQPGNVTGRDAGASGTVGGRSLWAFGDTLFASPSASGAPFVTNSGALDAAGYLPLSEPVDGTGAPGQLIPFTPGEAWHNASTSASRYAVWPSSVIPRSNGNGLIFYKRAIQPGPAPGSEAVGLADITPGATVATRRPEWLFGPNDCQWGIPFLAPDGYVYLYANLTEARTGCPDRGNGGLFDFPVGVARVPINSAGTRSAYRFWDGSAWVVDQTDTARITSAPGGPSVAWNETLDSYLAITGFGDEMRYATAPAPQGPWSSFLPFANPLPSGNGEATRAWRLHPELGPADGGVVLVSYHRAPANGQGQIRLMAVDLRADAAARLAAYVERTYLATVGYAPAPADATFWTERLRTRAVTTRGFVASLQASGDAARTQVRERYQAVLGRSPEPEALTYWAGWLEAHGHASLTSKLVALAEFTASHPTSTSFVEAVYLLALGREADDPGLAHWRDQIDSGAATRAGVALALLRTVEAGRFQARLAYDQALDRLPTPDQAAFVGSGYAALGWEPELVRRGVSASPEALA